MRGGSRCWNDGQRKPISGEPIDILYGDHFTTCRMLNFSAGFRLHGLAAWWDRSFHGTFPLLCWLEYCAGACRGEYHRAEPAEFTALTAWFCGIARKPVACRRGEILKATDDGAALSCI